jgi:hypothetical protein
LLWSVPYCRSIPYIHWGWIQISVANFTVIILMVVVFVVALFAPFPGRHKSESDREL